LDNYVNFTILIYLH